MQLQCPDNFNFYQGTDKPKVTGFLETFKNPIYLKIILITPGIIGIIKLKIKRMEKVLVSGFTNTNIKQNY